MIRERVTPQEQSCDICIVGSGPVGIALALEFERLGRNVVVLESGGCKVDARLAEASRADIADTRRHAPMEMAVCRALGGTSWTWGGRCVAFDDVDFEARSYVPNSGWPIRHEDIKPYYLQAAEYLCCGNDTFFSAPRLLPEIGDEISMSSLERWSSDPQLALAHRDRMQQSQRITFCLNSTVVDLELAERGGVVDEVVVHGPAAVARIKAGTVILAAGGIETTRLLLAVQRRWSKHFGALNGPLGRYYMGHISGKIANVVLNQPEAIADLDFEKDATGTYVRRRFTLSAGAQQRDRVFNTSFFPDNPPFHDARHRSSVLSAVFMALAVAPIGRRILPEAIRQAHVGSGARHFGAHLRNVLLDGPRGALVMSEIVRNRFLSKPRRPGFLVRNREGRYALHYHAEQEPNPESRVALASEKDEFGLTRVSIDLRFTENDALSVVRSHEILDLALRKSSVGRLEYWYPQAERVARVLAQASDGFHQAGTTRMGRDPGNSVVDTNLKAHDVANLYVASSSVFPTTGQANSTFLAVALAVRLAHHLQKKQASDAWESDLHASR